MAEQVREIEQPEPTEQDFEWADEMVREHERDLNAQEGEERFYPPDEEQRGYR